jgi:hypothetical protein
MKLVILVLLFFFVGCHAFFHQFLVGFTRSAKPYINQAVDYAGNTLLGENYQLIDAKLDRAGELLSCKMFQACSEEKYNFYNS